MRSHTLAVSATPAGAMTRARDQRQGRLLGVPGEFHRVGGSDKSDAVPRCYRAHHGHQDTKRDAGGGPELGSTGSRILTRVGGSPWYLDLAFRRSTSPPLCRVNDKYWRRHHGAEIRGLF